MLLEELAAAVDVPIGIRVSAPEYIEGGLDTDEVADWVETLASDADLAYVHVSRSVYTDAYSLSTQVADMTLEPSEYRSSAALLRTRLGGIPVIDVCRVETLAQAEGILERGGADMVGMVRALIANPRLPGPLAGRSEDGRAEPSCIYINQGCLGAIELGATIACSVNPEVGEEAEWARIRELNVASRRVLVVGAGVAGLEASASAALRGHHVTLVERSLEPGGALLLAARMPRREKFRTLVGELVDRARGSGVRFETGSRMTAKDAVAGDWDVIILATGGEASREPSSMAAGTTASGWSIEEAIDQDVRGRHIAVLDQTGDWVAPDLAADLSNRGAEVELVTPGEIVASNVTMYSRLALLERLKHAGVNVRVSARLVPARHGVEIRSDHNRDRVRMSRLDAIVSVQPRRANDSLVRDLRELGYANDVYLVGDAWSPRGLLEAVREGRLAALAVGIPSDRLAHLAGYRPPILHGSN
jgi:NADPH-dependent 2,4-dienoyl-CoA reductase/sulfur reductase-like enzyme